MNFFGLLTFKAPFLPWVLFGFSLMLGNSVMVDLIGKLLIFILYLLPCESKNCKHFDLIQTGGFCTSHNEVQGMQANLNTANQITIALCSLVFACLIGFFFLLHSNIPKIFLVVFWVLQEDYNYIFIYFLSSSLAWLLASLSGWLHMSLQVLQWVMSIISWRTCFQSSQVVLGYSRLQELCENIRRELLKPTINTHCFNLLCDRISYISQSVAHKRMLACLHTHACTHAPSHSFNQSISQSIN